MPSSLRPLRLAVATAIVCGLSLGGCGLRRQAEIPPSTTLPTPQELDSVVSSRRESVSTLRALARVRIKDPAGTVASREAIVVARPARLRVEVLSAFGSLLVFTVDEGQLRAYASGEDTVYTGTASPENLSRYAGVGLAPDHLVDLLLGTPPSQPGAAGGEVAVDSGTGWIALTQPMVGGSRITWFTAAWLPVAVEDRNDAGEVLWRASFDGHETYAGASLPTRIILEAPPLGRAVDIALNDIDVNPRLDAAAFALRAPAGARVVSLDTAGE
ncbi:DUF4292 domain-containing protein [Candidatus Binatia bacterium]|nr:DUF4292 domain-containing protein [Candidatus Binatia bacterium]